MYYSAPSLELSLIRRIVLLHTLSPCQPGILRWNYQWVIAAETSLAIRITSFFTHFYQQMTHIAYLRTFTPNKLPIFRWINSLSISKWASANTARASQRQQPKYIVSDIIMNASVLRGKHVWIRLLWNVKSNCYPLPSSAPFPPFPRQELEGARRGGVL